MSSTLIQSVTVLSPTTPVDAHYIPAYARNVAHPSAPIEPYGIDLKALSSGSVIVDVGGGVGTSCLGLANTYPHLRFVVQDSSREGINTELENAYCIASDGRVKFQVHDILTPQPVCTVTLFVLRNIMPNLSESDVSQVLAHLRFAAAPSTQLVVLDHEHPGGRTPQHISQLLRSTGWEVTVGGVGSGQTYPFQTIVATPM